MAEPTNGPWEILKLSGKLDDWTGSSIVIRAKGAPGGLCIIMGGLGASEEMANAHLIATSPELLEALKECAEVACAETCDHVTQRTPVHTPECISARRVIAKATGEVR